MSSPVADPPQDPSSSSAPDVAPVESSSASATPQPPSDATETASASADANHSNAPTPSTAAAPVRRRTLSDYRLGRTLGEGSYSTVVLAFDLSNRRDYAIKVLDKRHIIREKKVKYVNIEKNTLYKLDHPGIVKLYSTFQDSSSLYYVLELCQNGELLTFIKKLGSFDENCTRFYAAQILTAVEYVHNQGVIHRDLKPENILLDHRMYIKLTDFGTAKMLEPSEDGTESDRANSFVGTAEYVSPELLTEKAACKSSDLWALGCIIYQLLAGRPPFKGSNEYQTFQKIVKLEYSFPAGFPATAMDLVSRLLVHDPNERLGANNTIDELKRHPFFDGVEWNELWNQPAPKLTPYLPPTPAHNTEPLRSDHDACLWNGNRAGETLMVVDPFRELGDSGSSLNNSGRDSLSSDDGLQRSTGAHEAISTSTNATTAAAPPTHATTAAKGLSATSQSLPELAEAQGDEATATANSAASNALPPQGPISKSTSASAAISSSAKPSSGSNGHTKNNGRNAFVALFLPNLKHNPSRKLLAKKSKPEQTENVDGGLNREGSKKLNLSRESSSVSLPVPMNEISSYSKQAQLTLQAELSPWQGSLLPAEMIIYQSPVLKRKGLFSRSCILVLTDFPRLLYFDDSNHYFSQLFNSNTNDAFNFKQQHQRYLQWEQLEQQRQNPYQYPSLPQESHNHAHPRRSTGGVENLTTASGFVLGRNGSKLGHQQARSEHIPGHVLSEDDATTQQSTSARTGRVSLELPTHHHHQQNGHNKIEGEKRTSAVSVSDQLSGSLARSGAESSAKSSQTNLAGSTNEQGNGDANGTTSSGRKATSASSSVIKASKKQAKLRGEIFFNGSVISEIKGKKCFFIHTPKKSYYFEELKEGEAERWVKVLGRCIEEWFGEQGGADVKAGHKARRQSKQLAE